VGLTSNNIQGLPGTYALAYLSGTSLAKKTSYIELTPGENQDDI
jgi:hypothetical protein